MLDIVELNILQDKLRTLLTCDFFHDFEFSICLPEGKKQAKSCKAKKKKSPENEQRKAKLPPASPGTDDVNSSTDDEQLSAAQSSAQSCDTMERGARPDNTTVKLDDSQTIQLKEQIKEMICAEPVLAKLVDQITAAVLEQVTQNVYAAINLDLEKNKKDLEKSRKQVNELEKKVKQMEKKLMDCENSQEEQEQYSRRNCLRICGMPEKKDENSDDVVLQLVNSKLNLGFQVRGNDFDRTHRIQPRKPRTEGAEQPRPLIVKFASKYFLSPSRCVSFLKRSLFLSDSYFISY